MNKSLAPQYTSPLNGCIRFLEEMYKQKEWLPHRILIDIKLGLYDWKPEICLYAHGSVLFMHLKTKGSVIDKLGKRGQSRGLLVD